MDNPPDRRVLWLIKGLGPGGAERLLLSLAELPRGSTSYEVAYLLPWKQHLVPALEAAGVRTHLLGGQRGMADLRWVARLRRLVASGHFDVVHVHSPALAAVVRPLLRTLPHRPRVVTTEHNQWSSHGPITRLANAVTQPLGDAHLSVSEEVSASMWPSLQASSTTVLHGVPVAALTARRSERGAARAELGLQDTDVVVACVANLRATKDHDTLLAAATIALERSETLRFLAVGQGPREAELRARLYELDLADRFRFTGYEADPVRILVAADMFTLSSRHEGLPIALLEAMAVGLPSVLTVVGGVPSVVTDGREGILVPPGDAAALADGYVALAVDATARSRLGAAAQERARAFDIAVAARTIEGVYDEVLARQR